MASLAVAGAVAAVCIAVPVLLWLWLEKRKRQQFELVGYVSALRIYPVKSCVGLEEKEGVVTKDGLKLGELTDRFFMIVRPNGDFVTMRQNVWLSGIRPSVEGDFLVLSADTMEEPLKVKIKPDDEELDSSKIIDCRMWKKNVKIAGVDRGDEASAWICEVLKEEGLRLVTAVPALVSTKRQPRRPNSDPGDTLIYQDKGPLLVTNDASHDALMSRMPEVPEKEKIKISNFRSNIVVKTDKAWDEDNWTELRIGETAHLRLFFPCDRCPLTTIDYDHWEKRNDGEPLKTLRTFRIKREFNVAGPMFGMLSGIVEEGKVKVGDLVYARRKRSFGWAMEQK